MALPHAQPLDVISLRPLGDALKQAVSTSLLKTDRLQLLHLVLPEHHDLHEHHLDDSCVLHCLEGTVEVVMPGGTRRLHSGELVVLPPAQPYALRARSAAAVLVTLLRPASHPQPDAAAPGDQAQTQSQAAAPAAVSP